jgi:hypothetical protein
MPQSLNPRCPKCVILRLTILEARLRLTRQMKATVTLALEGRRRNNGLRGLFGLQETGSSGWLGEVFVASQALGPVTQSLHPKRRSPTVMLVTVNMSSPRLVLQNILREIAKTPSIILLMLLEAARQGRKLKKAARLGKFYAVTPSIVKSVSNR